jgi:TetR/AcrR family transcriptional regulator, transcriptional repressor of bet genes
VPKLGMQPIRRQQLIDATIATIHRHGFGETTVQRIARAAGVSPGIVHHYFRGKDDLLAATMRWLLEDLRRDLVGRLASLREPRARLRAVLAANFAPCQFRPEVISAWLAFWAQSAHDPDLARLRRIYMRRTLANLREPLRRLLPPAGAAAAAATLAALIDGLWLRAAHRDTGLEPADVPAILEGCLAFLLPADRSS